MKGDDVVCHEDSSLLWYPSSRDKPAVIVRDSAGHHGREEAGPSRSMSMCRTQSQRVSGQQRRPGDSQSSDMAVTELLFTGHNE